MVQKISIPKTEKKQRAGNKHHGKNLCESHVKRLLNMNM